VFQRLNEAQMIADCPSYLPMPHFWGLGVYY